MYISLTLIQVPLYDERVASSAHYYKYWLGHGHLHLHRMKPITIIHGKAKMMNRKQLFFENSGKRVVKLGHFRDKFVAKHHSQRALLNQFSLKIIISSNGNFSMNYFFLPMKTYLPSINWTNRSRKIDKTASSGISLI